MNAGAQDARLLRCTAFEELMLDQDSIQNPCVICVRLDLSGEVNVPHMRHALAQVIAAHPLLRARLQVRWGKLWWNVHAEGLVSLQTYEVPAPAWPGLRNFDLSNTFGLHVDLYAPGACSDWTLFLHVHHVIADGLGCLQIVDDLLRAYGQVAPQLSARDADHLRDRNRFGLSWAKMLRMIPQQLSGWDGVWQFSHPQASASAVGGGYRLS